MTNLQYASDVILCFAPGPLKSSRTQKSHQCTKSHVILNGRLGLSDMNCQLQKSVHFISSNTLYSHLSTLSSQRKRVREEEKEKKHLHSRLRHVTYCKTIQIFRLTKSAMCTVARKKNSHRLNDN